MSLIVLGMLTAAVGFVAIGFGIPVNAFSIGNTLIMAGATAVVGGFLLIGLGAVVRELKRLAQAPWNAAHAAVAPTPAALSDPFEARAHFVADHTQRDPAYKPEPPRTAASSEPKTVLANSAEPDASIAWLRPRNGEPTLGERAVIEELEASLAPQPAAQPAPRTPPAPTMPKIADAKAWMPLNATEQAAEAVTSQRPDTPTRPMPQRAPGGVFESVWPDARPPRNAESVERRRRPDVARPVRDDTKAKDGRATPAVTPAPTPDDQRPVAILKSGMIDGMAYTLYADGSIEAVLPTGPIRFASVDALRAHLDRSA